ncbi:MAG: chemotaxis protein CheC [Dehalococcoidales bacterium]
MQNATRCTLDRRSSEDTMGLVSVETNMSAPMPDLALSREDMAVWLWLVSKGIANALSGLSQMVGHEIKVTSLDLKQLPAKDAAGLLGGADAPGIGIYLSIEGDATGHLLLIHEPKIAFQFIDLQLGLALGSTNKIEEMGRSVLGEMGNITGAFFLNILADSADLVLMPSPPSVIVDIVGAIMSIPFGSIEKVQDDAIVVKATFNADDRQMEGMFMVLPTMDFMNTVLSRSRGKLTPA